MICSGETTFIYTYWPLLMHLLTNWQHWCHFHWSQWLIFWLLPVCKIKDDFLNFLSKFVRIFSNKVRDSQTKVSQLLTSLKLLDMTWTFLLSSAVVPLCILFDVFWGYLVRRFIHISHMGQELFHYSLQMQAHCKRLCWVLLIWLLFRYPLEVEVLVFIHSLALTSLL